MGRVDGKVALISGGAQGMGASHARALAAERHRSSSATSWMTTAKPSPMSWGRWPVFVHLDVHCQQVRQLAADWCGQGATVDLDTALIPPLIPSTIIGHAVELIPGLDAGQDWIAERFAGKPAPNNCGALS